MLDHLAGLFTHPHEEWEDIDREIERHGHGYLSHMVVLAALPGLCMWYGTSVTGWSTGLDTIRLESTSAFLLGVAAWLGIICAVTIMGLFIHWLAKTYGCDPSWSRCVIFAAYTATPLYLTGFLGLFPSIPLALFGILAAIAYAVYLLYAGLPHIMHIPFEQGFMMATSIVAVGLVVLVSMKVMTIVLWDMGLGSIFSLG